MRTLRYFAVLLVSTTAIGLVGALPAKAEVTCYVKDEVGRCTLSVSTDPAPGGGGGGGGDSKVVVNGVECLSVTRADPQPSPDDAVWNGHYPEGSIYVCHAIGAAMGGGAVPEIRFWSPVALGGATPRELAQQAVEDMRLEAPEIGLTGYGWPNAFQVIGLPTWMWIADPGESTTGPIVRSVSAGGLTVTASARLRETVWQMGDGGAVTCLGENAAGTPYADSYDKAPSPTCGYRYTRTSANEPGKAYTVAVTANWQIEWSGGGQSGVIPMSLARTTQLRVGEIQVIVNGSGQGKP